MEIKVDQDTDQNLEVQVEETQAEEPKKKEKKVEATESAAPRWYEGYDMKWLKGEIDHPDYYLVAEYEAKFGEIK